MTNRVTLAFAALVVILSASLPAKADRCDALAPTNAQDVDEQFKGKLDGEINGRLSSLIGGSASIEGLYRNVETDQLRNYPDSNKLYVWQRIIYLVCINPDLKIDINDLLKLYFSPPPNVTGSICPPGTTPAPHPAVGIENDHSAIGSEYTDTQSSIYNFCSVVNNETSATTSQSNEDKTKTVYRYPKLDPSGNPCQRYMLKQELTYNFVIEPPGFNPFELPAGTCLAEQVVIGNYGATVTNHDLSITKQTSSGNVPIQ
jgi:hypothetical protein